MLVHPQFDPIALDLSKIGIPIAVHWYGITYLVGFGLFLFLAARRARLPQFASRGWARRPLSSVSASRARNMSATRLRPALPG